MKKRWQIRIPAPVSNTGLYRPERDFWSSVLTCIWPPANFPYHQARETKNTRWYILFPADPTILIFLLIHWQYFWTRVQAKGFIFAVMPLWLILWMFSDVTSVYEVSFFIRTMDLQILKTKWFCLRFVPIFWLFTKERTLDQLVSPGILAKESNHPKSGFYNALLRAMQEKVQGSQLPIQAIFTLSTWRQKRWKGAGCNDKSEKGHEGSGVWPFLRKIP